MPATRWDDLESAASEERWGDALNLALAAWRERRSALLGRIVELIAFQLSPAPIRGAGAPAFQRAWLERARTATAADIGPLLTTVARSVPTVEDSDLSLDEGGAVTRYAAWLDRIRALEPLPNDPRIAAALLDVVLKAPWSSYFATDIAALYDPALDSIRRNADDRILDRLRALVDVPTVSRQAMRRHLANTLPGIVAELESARERRGSEPVPKKLLDLLGIDDVDDVGRVAHEKKEKSGLGEVALLDLVIANPEDDDPREVLADLWLERDDPRGRLIALQLKDARGGATEADHKAIRKILRDHEKSWIGEIGLVTSGPGRTYRRGFLDEITLLQNAAADTKVWERVVLDPRLATVRKVAKGKANEAHYRRFVFSPAMRSLREIAVMSKSMLTDVCDRPEPWPIEHLVLELMPDKKAFAAIHESASLPDLSRLTVGVRQGGVEKVLHLVADFAARRPLERIGVLPLRWYENLEPLARWLNAAADTLAHVAAVEIVFPYHAENRISARRGSKGLQVELVGNHVHFLQILWPDLKGIERFELRAPTGGALFGPDTEPAKAFLAKLPRKLDVELDSAWTAAFASAKPGPPRHRDA